MPCKYSLSRGGAALALLLVVTPVFSEDHPTTRSDVMDVGSVSLFGHRLNPQFRLGYFDNEGNTMQSGVIRSMVGIRDDPGNPQAGEMEVRFTVPNGWNNYAGWYIADPAGTDLSGKNFLQFEIKVHPLISPKSLQLGIRSRNVRSDENRAKIFLSDLGIEVLPDNYITVSIPVSMLQEKEPNLDLAQVTELFIIAVVAPTYDVEDLPVWVRSVRWDSGEKKEKE